MPLYQFKLPRLYIEHDLALGLQIELSKDQHNYVANVLRAKPGFEILLFNGQQGEWLAKLGSQNPQSRRQKLYLEIKEQTRAQTPPNDLRYIFAPIKHARQDYMVQKAVEMGVSELVPVQTQYAQISKVNTSRMHANAVEACEQCGVINLPIVRDLVPLADLPEITSGERLLVFCDERAPIANPAEQLGAYKSQQSLSVIIGPEGGFSDQEREMLNAIENSVSIALGPRILRADTAAIAALSAVQMILGDWN